MFSKYYFFLYLPLFQSTQFFSEQRSLKIPNVFPPPKIKYMRMIQLLNNFCFYVRIDSRKQTASYISSICWAGLHISACCSDGAFWQLLLGQRMQKISSPNTVLPTPNSKQRGQILCSLSQTASFLFRNGYNHGTGISESQLIKTHGDSMDSNIKCKISKTKRVWMWSELTQRNPPFQEALWVKK